LSLQLTPEENLRWYAGLSGSVAAMEPRAALAEVGLGGFEDLPCQRLSAGQQRRAGLARLLTCAAPLWFLDEPLTSLDDAGAALMRELIEEHTRSNGAAVCATHQSLGVEDGHELQLGAA
jgi:heme exporter protein A